MAECRHALPHELAQTHQLWQRVFGDMPQVQDAFYQLCAPQGPLVLVEQGRVESMLALTPVSLALPHGALCQGTYLYALATHPEARGKGYAAQLMAYAAQWTAGQGLDFVCTVPAQPSLFDFFGQHGYTPAFYHQRTPLPPPQCGQAQTIFPHDYVTLRETLLGTLPHIVHTAGQAAFEGQLHGSLYRLELPHGPGCAVVEHWGETHIVKELLTLPGDETAGAGLVSALCRGQGELRTPCVHPHGTPFGAMHWLTSPPAGWNSQSGGYLGLALD